MEVEFLNPRHIKEKADVVVIPVYEGLRLGPIGQVTDTALEGYIKYNAQTTPSFEGKAGQMLTLTAPQIGLNTGAKRILLAGMGSEYDQSTETAEMIGAALYTELESTGFETALFMAEEFDDSATLICSPSSGPANRRGNSTTFTAALGNATYLKSYKFDKYKTGPKAQDSTLKKLTVAFNKNAAAKAEFEQMKTVSDGVFLARDMSNEPPNVMYPESAAQIIQDELKPLGVKVRVIDEKEMERLGMGAALAVGKGSINPPRMVVMEYDGTDGSSNDVPLALVGKGVTFDTGGYNLKPAGGINDMKHDMGGAAAVVGAFKALAGRKANAKVVGIVGLVENRISDRAYLPSDIITTMAGKTVEIGNTDAEGRLVLADALTYIQRKYDPEKVFDFATLTGACLQALGHDAAGIFTEDYEENDLIQSVRDAGRKVSEKLWPLPLSKNFSDAMIGREADLANLGSFGGGGASAAAAFLENFIDEGREWVHFDIAGMAMNITRHPYHPARGATGFGVRLIDRYVADNIEPPQIPGMKPGGHKPKP